MKGVGTIFRRELAAYFNSAIAYVFLIVFIGLLAFIYSSEGFQGKRADMRFYFDVVPWVLPVFTAALTMRLWAEERKQGTVELLLTLPMELRALVLGKYLACLTFYALALTGSLPIAAILVFGWNSDPGAIIGGYIGALLAGAFYLAVGAFISAFTRDQIVAFILTLIACVMLFFLGFEFFGSAVDNVLPGVGAFILENFGVPTRLQSLGKGVFDWGDVLYFLCMTGSFLYLNYLGLASLRRWQDRTRLGTASLLVIVAGMLLSLNLTEARPGRIDMTKGRLYTVTEATRQILARLQDPVQITYYATARDKMPSDMKETERDVRDFLRELSQINGRVQVKVVDPQSDPELERKVKSDKGIRALEKQVTRQDRAELVRFYSGLVISYRGKDDETIEYVGPETLDTLEYDVVRRIHKLALDRKPKVALYSPSPKFDQWQMMMGRRPQDDYARASSVLREEGYEVVKVDFDKDKVPGDADALIVLGPENLTGEQVREIEKHVESGRNLLVAVQNYSLSVQPDSLAGFLSIPITKKDSKLAPALEKWGVEAADEVLLDANLLALPEEMETMLGTARVNIPLPTNVLVGAEGVDASTSLLNGVVNLVAKWSSPLKLKEEKLREAGIQSTVLVRSSPKSWTVPTSRYSLAAADLDDRRAEFKGPFPIAVLLEKTSAKDQGEKTKSRIVVVSSAEMLSDRVMRFLGLGNATFFLNLVDSLTFGEALLGVRSKKVTPVLMTDVTGGKALLYRFLFIGAAPAFWLLFGVGRLIRRKSRRQAYLRQFAHA